MVLETRSWIIKSENITRSRFTLALAFIYWLLVKPVGQGYDLDWLNKTDYLSVMIINYSLQSVFIWLCLSILLYDAAKCVRNHGEQQFEKSF
jgi:hypothetical protein